MGFVQSKTTVEGSSPYGKWNFKEVGDSITCLVMGKGTRSSQEYGDFNVLEVVKFNPDANTVEEAVESAELVAFPIATVLNNQFDSGVIVPNECYTITFSLDRGQEYIAKNGGKAKAKAKHYKVERLGVPSEGINALKAKAPKMVVSATPVEEPTPAEPAPSTPRV